MRPPPRSSMLRNNVTSPDCASDDMSTMENAPIVIERTVSAERNLCAWSARHPIRGYSRNRTGFCKNFISFHFIFGRRRGLDENALPLGDATRDLDVAIVAHAELHLGL